VDDIFFIGTIVLLSGIVGFIGGVTWVWWLAGTPSDPDYG
jgi:hypothetical protein